MLRSTHAIETFQKNGLINAAEELGHSRIATTKNNYLKPEENDLYLNEEKMRFNNSDYNNIFECLPNKEKQFIKKKRNNSTKKSKKEKLENKDLFNDENFSIQEYNSDSEDYSVFEDIFDYKMVPNLNIAKEDRENIDKPCNRENNISNASLKDQNNKGEYIQYIDFIRENKITINNVITIDVDYASSKNVIKFKTSLNEYFNNKISSNEVISQKEKADINNINFCHNLKDIIFYDISSLDNIHKFISSKKNIYPNNFKILIGKKGIQIVSNIEIEKNTFICDVNGYYGYKKSEKN